MRKVLKIIGSILAVLLGLVIVVAAVVYFVSESKFNKTYEVPTPALAASTDPAVIERGRHLATTVSVCVDCHTESLGGQVFVDDPALGRIIALNLTKGQNGIGNELSDADIARVLRYGVKPDGTSVKIMPSDDYQHLSDEDLIAIISYVRSVPPVDSNLPATQLGPVGRILVAAGQLPILIAENTDHASTGVTAPPAGVTADYGHYMMHIAGCTGCHGEGLSGGKIPSAPPDTIPAANITVSGAVKGWTEEQFLTAIRTGTDPNGHVINEFMPWKRYGNMSDEELKAIWAYIQVAPPKEYGNR
jgi:mono/diheme cytochrome c family protein